MRTLYTLLVIFLCFCILINCKEEQEDQAVFVATKEWQIVKQGQAVPKGLHIRFNLEKGITEAKLLSDDNDDPKNAMVTTPEEDPPKKHVKLDPVTLKRVKSKPRLLKRSNMVTSLIAEHDELDWKVQEDKLRILELLEKIEDMVHQIDHATEFTNAGGFEKVIYKNLNTTSNSVKLETLLVLGACAQNNQEIQSYAFQSGTLTILHRILEHDSSVAVKNRAVYALGSLLRLYPAAQSKFIKTGGLKTLLNLLESSNLKLKLKITTLLNDLMIERYLQETIPMVELAKGGIQYSELYKDVEVQKLLLQENYCKLLIDILRDLILINQTDYHELQIVLFAMETLKESCGVRYSNSDAKFLINLYVESKKVIKESRKDDEDYPYIKAFVDSLHEITKILGDDLEKQKTEL